MKDLSPASVSKDIKEAQAAIDTAQGVIAKISEKYADLSPGFTIRGISELAAISRGLTTFANDLARAHEVINAEPGTIDPLTGVKLPPAYDQASAPPRILAP